MIPRSLIETPYLSARRKGALPASPGGPPSTGQKKLRVLNPILRLAKMPTPGETAGACAYYKDGEARWLAYIEIGCRFTEEANR